MHLAAEPIVPHVAWVTTPADDAPRRLELRASDPRDCIRRALIGMPPGSRASCRELSRGYDVERRAQ